VRTLKISIPVILVLFLLIPQWAKAQIEVRAVEKVLEAGPVRGMVAVVDLADPRVSVHVTAPFDRSAATRPIAAEVDSRLIPTDVWARDNNLTLAINASFFAWIKGDDSKQGGADVVGMSVSNGTVVSEPREWKGQPDPAVVFLKSGGARIIGPGQPTVSLAEIEHAVAGVGGGEKDATPGTLLVQGGKNLGKTARVATNVRHPRTAVGVDASGKKLYIMVVDGRQPKWSIGMTLPELAEWMIELGAVDAVNLDGGGSSAFVYTPVPGEKPVTNRPSDQSTEAKPGIFRAVANHLGFRVSPGDEKAPTPTNRGDHGAR
jgi:hypothetical protein